jgi:membrane protein insertase Oxa1/YidC/SpoIIIJ
MNLFYLIKAVNNQDITQTLPPETSAPNNIQFEQQDLSSGYIPEPPPIIDENLILNAVGEPTLQSLGLGSWWPSGIVQQALEYLHADLGLSWIQAIAIFTIILRTCLIPITIKAQQNSGKMRKIAPQMTKINEKLNEAKLNGNPLESIKFYNFFLVLTRSIF